MKITQDELNQLADLRTSIATLITELGTVSYQLTELEEQRIECQRTLRKTLGQQQEFEAELFIKYGEGALNLETGEITPLDKQ